MIANNHEPKNKKLHMTKIGGQAVIEGVMMRGPLGTCIAIRTPSGEITTKTEKKGGTKEKNFFAKLPIVRGVINFFESMVIGTKALMYSADFVDMEEDDDQPPSKFEKFLMDKLGDNLKNVIVYLSLFISLVFSIGLFILLPTYIAGITNSLIENAIIKTLIEGLVRIILFLGYLILVSKMEDIKRVFAYHGAEHKTIFAYENHDQLTVEAIRKYPRLHPRCGTNFLLFVMIVSIIIFSFLKWDNLTIRIISRLCLLPVVAGISYEIIKWAGRSDNPIVKTISYPGLMLQKITTREPDDAQIEVAIAAIKGVMTQNKEDDKW